LKITRLFSEHPASVGESYAEHFRAAIGFSLTMLAGALACLVHAVFPFLCVTTGSRAIARLHERMIVNRTRRAPCEPARG
jgi:hypothetical protein